MDAGFVAAQTQALQENAERLGIVWKRRPATVVAPLSDDPTGVTVVMDGDSVAINAYSLIGVPPVDSRIMCDIVPPSGLYIVGYIGQPPDSLLGGNYYSSDGARVTVSATEVLVPGYEITVFEPPNKLLNIKATFKSIADTPASTALFRIRENDILGNIFCEQVFTYPTHTFGYPLFMEQAIAGFGSSRTYVLTAQRIGGSGTFDVTNKNNQLDVFILTDIGNLNQVTLVT